MLLTFSTAKNWRYGDMESPLRWSTYTYSCLKSQYVKSRSSSLWLLYLRRLYEIWFFQIGCIVPQFFWKWRAWRIHCICKKRFLDFNLNFILLKCKLPCKTFIVEAPSWDPHCWFDCSDISLWSKNCDGRNDVVEECQQISISITHQFEFLIDALAAIVCLV